MYHNYLTIDHIKKHSKAIFFTILIGFIGSIVSFLLSVSVGEFYILYFSSDGSKGRLLDLLGVRFENLSSFYIFFGILLILKFFTGYFERWLSYTQGEIFTRKLREQLFAQQVSNPKIFFADRSFGQYLLRYSNDMKAINSYLVKGILGFYRDLLFLSIGFMILFTLNSTLSFYLVSLSAIITVALYSLAKRQKTTIRQSRNKRSSLLAFVATSFSRYREDTGKGASKKRIDRFNLKSADLYESNLENYKWESIQLATIPFLQFLMIGGLLAVIGFSSIEINHADAIVFILLTLMMLSPFRRILRVPSIVNKGNISLKKIETLMERSGEVEFENVKI